jgi:hypothetical protein
VAQTNDILTYEFEDGLEHAAIYLGENSVFEKVGIFGAYHYTGPYEKPNSVYRITTLERSMLEQKCTTKFCMVNTYRCQSADLVRKTLSQCNSRFKDFNAAQLEQGLNGLTFDQDEKVTLSSNMIQLIDQWAAELARLQTSDLCSMYELVRSFSIYIYLLNVESNLRSPQPDIELPFLRSFTFTATVRNFKNAFKIAFLQAEMNLKDQQSKKIFADINSVIPWLLEP